MSDADDRNGEVGGKPPRSRARDLRYAMRTRELTEKYAGLMIAVYDCEVWGSGESDDDALVEALARPGAPAVDEFVVVGMPEPDGPHNTFPITHPSHQRYLKNLEELRDKRKKKQ